MSYEDNKAMALTHSCAHTRGLTVAGDHTMSHHRAEILCSQWVMKLWQSLSQKAEKAKCKSRGAGISVARSVQSFY